MSGNSVKVWDLPIRLVHWSFVILLPWLWWTGEEGDLATHQKLGLVMLGLVVFRLLWGFFGSDTARFARFVRGPGAILDYIRGKTARTIVGHNPLGALSVLGLLGLLAAQTGFGLIAQDVDGIESGPLSYLVSYDTADWARGWHHLLFDLILIVVGLHLLAILFYLFVRRDNLVRPIVTGRKKFERAVTEPMMAPLWRFLVCAVIAGALAWWVSLGAPMPGSG